MIFAGLSIATGAAADSAQKVALERVAADLPADLGVLAVELPEAIKARELAPGDLSVRWKRAPRAGTMSIQFVVSQGSEQNEHWGRVVLGDRAEVLVAARALAAGETIASGDLVSLVETVPRGEGWRLAPGALVGAKVLRDVGASAQVSDIDIAAPPPLARGSEVSVEIHRGSVRVATRGVLERAARPGEEVSIRLTATKRTVRARLFSADLAVARSEGKR